MLGAVAIAACALWAFRAFTVDDAFIAYRHARNWAHGHGAVMNPGERVEGVSNLPWTLALGVAASLGVPPHAAGPRLSAAAALVTVLAAFVLARRAGVGGGVAALVTAVFAPLAIWGASGMETAAFALVVAAAVTLAIPTPGAASRRRTLAAGIAFALASALRPEGIAFALAAAFALALSPGARRRAGTIAAIAVCGFIALALVRLAVYGDWLPNPARAKSPSLAGLVPGMLYAATLLLSYPLAFAALVLRGARAEARVTVAAVVGAQLAIVIAVGGDHFAGYRFLVPVWPLLALAVSGAAAPHAWRRVAHPALAIALAAAGAVAIAWPGSLAPVAAWIADLGRLQLPVEAHAARIASEVRHAGAVALATAATLAWLRRRSGVHGPSASAALVLTAALAVPQLLDPRILSCLRADGASRTGTIVGRALAARAPTGTLVATNAAGALAYWSDLPVIDMLGLTDRHIARARPDTRAWIGHERGDGAYVLDRAPDLIVLGGAEGSPTPWPFSGDREIAADARFIAHYVESRLPLAPQGAPPFEFIYFCRRESRACPLPAATR